MRPRGARALPTGCGAGTPQVCRRARGRPGAGPARARATAWMSTAADARAARRGEVSSSRGETARPHRPRPSHRPYRSPRPRPPTWNGRTVRTPHPLPGRDTPTRRPKTPNSPCRSPRSPGTAYGCGAREHAGNRRAAQAHYARGPQPPTDTERRPHSGRRKAGPESPAGQRCRRRAIKSRAAGKERGRAFASFPNHRGDRGRDFTCPPHIQDGIR